MPGLIRPEIAMREWRASQTPRARPPPPKETPVSITNIELKFADSGDFLTYDAVAALRERAQRERERNPDGFKIPKASDGHHSMTCGRQWMPLPEVADATCVTQVLVKSDDELYLMWSDVDLFLKRVQEHIWRLGLRASDADEDEDAEREDVACGVVHGQLRTDKKAGGGGYVELGMRVVLAPWRPWAPGLTTPRSHGDDYGQRSLAWHASRFHESVFRPYRDQDIPPLSLPRSEDDSEDE
ncbi:hypothetical protein ANO14919_055490 [Xylariales sp. No.14919]|nr:hypothetical protein ANO14919_055490 [Xylariales sp. No.14919]